MAKEGNINKILDFLSLIQIFIAVIELFLMSPQRGLTELLMILVLTFALRNNNYYLLVAYMILI